MGGKSREEGSDLHFQRAKFKAMGQAVREAGGFPRSQTQEESELEVLPGCKVGVGGIPLEEE